MQMVDAMMWTQMPKYAHLHTIILKIVKSVQTVSLQHVTVMNIYSSMDAVIALYIYIWLVIRELQWGYYRGKSAGKP